MAGHSKFKNIMHRKGTQDAKRSKKFSKLGKEIQVAAKLGGADINGNPRLRIAIQNAKAVSMPKDRIDRAIQSGVGSGAGDDYMELRYEGYGPGGVAIIVETLTNNKNRTAGDVRSTFDKYGGNMGATGSVGFMFDRVGEIIYPATVSNPEAVFEAALEAGAQDVQSDSDHHEIITTPEDFTSVRDALVTEFGEPEKSGLAWKANTMAPADEEKAREVFELIEVLEDNDDVQSVISNMEISDSVMQKFAAS